MTNHGGVRFYPYVLTEQRIMMLSGLHKRKEKGIPQEQLAQKMSYSTQFISNIESKNHQTFSLGTLWRLALVLNIDIKELFEENEK